MHLKISTDIDFDKLLFFVFFAGPRLDEHLTPAPLVDSSLSNNPVFKIPIVVIPG